MRTVGISPQATDETNGKCINRANRALRISPISCLEFVCSSRPTIAVVRSAKTGSKIELYILAR